MPRAYIDTIFWSKPVKRKAALVLTDQLGLVAPFPVSRHLDPDRTVVRYDRLAAGAVAVVALVFGLLFPGRVAQVTAHLGVHGPLDDRLLQRSKQRVQIALGHRALNQLIEQLLRNF
jgi:hypothetical protein